MSGLESELFWFTVLNGTWQTEKKPGPRTEASGGFLGKIKRVCKDTGSREPSHFPPLCWGPRQGHWVTKETFVVIFLSV